MDAPTDKARLVERDLPGEWAGRLHAYLTHLRESPTNGRLMAWDRIAIHLTVVTTHYVTGATVQAWHEAMEAAPKTAEAPHAPPTAGPQPPTPRTENQP